MHFAQTRSQTRRGTWYVSMNDSPKSPNGRNRAALLGTRGVWGCDSLPFVSRIDRRAPRPARRGARCSRKPRSRSTPPRSQIFPVPLPLARRSARRAGAASVVSVVGRNTRIKRGGHIFKISKLHYPLIYNKRGRPRVNSVFYIYRDESRSEIKCCNPKNQIRDHPEKKWYLSQSGCGIKSGINTTFLARNCGTSVAPRAANSSCPLVVLACLQRVHAPGAAHP